MSGFIDTLPTIFLLFFASVIYDGGEKGFRKV